jgi:hypothetical protein
LLFDLLDFRTGAMLGRGTCLTQGDVVGGAKELHGLLRVLGAGGGALKVGQPLGGQVAKIFHRVVFGYCELFVCLPAVSQI